MMLNTLWRQALPVQSLQHAGRAPPHPSALSRCAAKSLSNGHVAPPAPPPESSEAFISVEDVLSDARNLGGDNFVFEDTEEDQPVWAYEEQLRAKQRQEAVPEAQVKGALDPNMQDILSAYSPEQGFQEISVDSLHERLQSSSEAGPTAVLDVRTAWEFSKGHIPGAMHISLDTLSDAVRQGALDAIEDQEIAVVCAAGIRSAQAAVRLTRVFNFKQVKNVGGGMNEWTQKGYPVE